MSSQSVVSPLPQGLSVLEPELSPSSGMPSSSVSSPASSHGSQSTQFIETCKVTEVPGILCAHEQMLFPIVDRVGNTLYGEKNRVFEKKFYDPSWSIFSAPASSMVLA